MNNKWNTLQGALVKAKVNSEKLKPKVKSYIKTKRTRSPESKL